MSRLRTGPGVELVVNLAFAVPSRRWRNGVAHRVLGWPADVQVGRGVRLQGVHGIRIGARVVIHRHTHLDLRGGIAIGDDVAISPSCAVLTADHDPDSPTREYRERGVTIGDRVWLGTGATLLPGTAVGAGCVVGAHAVAHGTLEPFTLYAGNPARPLRPRSRDAQQRLAGTMRRFQ